MLTGRDRSSIIGGRVLGFCALSGKHWSCVKNSSVYLFSVCVRQHI